MLCAISLVTEVGKESFCALVVLFIIEVASITLTVQPLKSLTISALHVCDGHGLLFPRSVQACSSRLLRADVLIKPLLPTFDALKGLPRRRISRCDKNGATTFRTLLYFISPFRALIPATSGITIA